MCSNKEVVQLVSHVQITFQRCYLVKVAVMPCAKRKSYQHVSDFDRGGIVAYCCCGLLYYIIAAAID